MDFEKVESKRSLALASEAALSRDWLSKKDEHVWKNLGKKRKISI